MSKKSDLKIKGTTGELCQVSGVYYCPGNGHSEIKVTIGEPFPPCLAGEHETEWVLRRDLSWIHSPLEDLDL